MANAVTLATLRARALDYADMTGSTFPVEARVNEYVNDAITELHDALINAREDFYLSTSAINIIAGTETYALPTDFYKLLKLWYTVGSRRYRIRRWSTDEVDGFRTSPISSGSAVLWYAPQVTKMTSDSDEVDDVLPNLPNGHEDFIALHAAARLAAREESFEVAGYLRSERDRALQRIVTMIEPRDQGEPESISDHYNRWDSRRELLNLEERSFRYRIMGSNIHMVEIDWYGV